MRSGYILSCLKQCEILGSISKGDKICCLLVFIFVYKCLRCGKPSDVLRFLPLHAL